MLAGAYELSRGGVREASCNLSFFPGSVWGSSRPGRFWATGDGSTAVHVQIGRSTAVEVPKDFQANWQQNP